MSIPTLEAVRNLAAHDEGPCLSLFMPTFRSGPEVRQNATRFGNLIKRAREQDESGTLSDRLDALAPLAENDEFWQHQSSGLAILADADEQRFFSVPRSLSERVVVADGYDLLPLLPVMQRNGHFHVIAVSEQEARLVVATAENVVEYPADLPEGLEDVMGSRHHKGFGLHSFRVRPRSDDGAVPHGHVEADEREQRLRYLREIDERLADVIADRDVPLVFAGDEQWFAQFREVSEHRGLLPEHVAGNPDDLSADDLQQKAMPLVQRVFDERIDEAVGQWQQARSGDLVVEEATAIAEAAARGQVAMVLYDAGALLDRAVGQTIDEADRTEQRRAATIVANVLAQGGSATAVPSDRMEGNTLAAVLRYAN